MGHTPLFCCLFEKMTEMDGPRGGAGGLPAFFMISDGHAAGRMRIRDRRE
jgi:hypothetical protein